MTIGPEGNVRSFWVGGTPFLGTGPDGKSGAFFLDENNQVATFSEVRQVGSNELVCAEGTSELYFRCFQDRLECVRKNPGSRYANWVWLPSQRVVRSVEATHDGLADFGTEPFDGYQPSPRWLSDNGRVLYMPYLVWQRKPAVSPDRNIAILSHGFGEGDEKPFVFRPVAHPQPQDALVFDIHCENPDFLLPGGKPVRFPTGVENLGRNEVNLEVRFRVLNFLDRTLVSSHTERLGLGGGQSRSLELSALLTEPGIYRAELTLIKGASSLRQMQWIFAYDWHHWNVPLTRRPDFAAFWDQTLQELRSKPLAPVVSPAPDKDRGGFKVFRVNFSSLGARRCYGWYLVPEGEGPFPAVLDLPGNGVYKMPFDYKWPLGRYIFLRIQVHGYDADLSNLPSPSPWKSGNYWAEWASRDEASRASSMPIVCGQLTS